MPDPKDPRVIMAWFIFISGLFGAAPVFSTSLRAKRSVIQLSGMIYCTTGRSAVTEVDCYGCYCGPGGEGTPVDDVDRCCKAHDDCYGDVTNNRTCPLGTVQDYLVAYGWSCDELTRSARCEDQQWVSQWLAGACGRAICRCDERLAMCLKNAKFQFPKPAPPLSDHCPMRSCTVF